MRISNYREINSLLEAVKKRKKLQKDNNNETHIEKINHNASQDLINDYNNNFNANKDLNIKSNTFEKKKNESLI